MKKSFEVLHDLFRAPCYKKVRDGIEALHFLPYIAKSVRDGINYIYVKGDTLYIVCNHSQFKFEFKYKEKDIMAGLKLFQDKKRMLVDVKHIKCFIGNSNSYAKYLDNVPHYVEYFNEKSSGEFENQAIDTDIYNAFERIRNRILDILEKEE